MLLKDTSKTKSNQELVKASIDALVKALESGHSEALSAYLTAMSQVHNYNVHQGARTDIAERSVPVWET